MKKTTCPICAHANAAPFLTGRGDHEYSVGTRLSYFKCIHADCGHVWVSPIPSDKVIASFYINYTTHGNYCPHGLGCLVNRISERLTDRHLRFLHANEYNVKLTRILDFGCGNGNNLKRLSNHGFNNLVGFDIDPEAIACASSHGFMCHSSWDDLSKEEKFNVAFQNHVIEHLSNPRSSLAAIFEMLSPGGLLIIRTPNARSSLARICGVHWRGWETPRHLNVFTYSSLCRLLNGLTECEIVQASTSNDMVFSMAISSLPKRLTKYKFIRLISACVLMVTSQIIKIFSSTSGEELVFKIKKK